MKKIFIKNENRQDLNKKLIELLTAQSYKAVVIKEFDITFDIKHEWICIDIVNKRYMNQKPLLKPIDLSHGKYVRYINSKNESKIGIIKTPSIEIEQNSVYVQSLTSDNAYPIRINKIVANVTKEINKYVDVQVAEMNYDNYLLLSSDLKRLESMLSVDITKPITAFKDVANKFYSESVACLGQVIDPTKYNNFYLDLIGVDKENALPIIKFNIFAYWTELETFNFSDILNKLLNKQLKSCIPLSERKANIDLIDYLTDDECKEQKLITSTLFTNYELTSELTEDDIEYVEDFNNTVMSKADIIEKVKADKMTEMMMQRKVNTIEYITVRIKNLDKIKVTPISEYLDYEQDEINEAYRDTYDMCDMNIDDFKEVYNSVNVLYTKDRIAELIKIVNSNRISDNRTQSLMKMFQKNIEDILQSRISLVSREEVVEVAVAVNSDLKSGDFYITSDNFNFTKAFAKWTETLGMQQHAISLNRMLPIWVNLDNKTFRSSKPVYGDISYNLNSDFQTILDNIIDGLNADDVLNQVNLIKQELDLADVPEEAEK